jgi:glycosyltransferase involved in cell wall biosynthesis
MKYIIKKKKFSKVGIFFDATRKNGGSFQMSVNNLITLINNFKKKKIKYIIFTNKRNIELQNLNIKYQVIKLSICDFFFLITSNTLFLKYLVNKVNFISPFEKKLIRNNINLVFYFSISWKILLLKKTYFISTLLDVAHYDFWGKKKFKEISLKVFLAREYLYKKILPLSFRIVTESEDLKKKIQKLYNLKSNNIIPIPNLPSFLLKKKINLKTINTKIKFQLFDKFYFYPSQFWEHKNHIVIIKAIKNLMLKKKIIKFVFCGIDKGYLKEIKNKITEYKIAENIRIIDYVNDTELLQLYKLCEALVMPSYFGPTNIPPVEAWSLGIPVIYTSLNRNHGKDACLYFDAGSSEQLSQAILKLDDNKNRLIRNGKKRFKDIKFENITGHKSLTKDINFFLKNNNKR